MWLGAERHATENIGATEAHLLLIELKELQSAKPAHRGEVEDPALLAPQQYRVLLENDRVRALEYLSQPGARSAMHWHPACLIYAFSPATITITTSYGIKADYEFSPGELLWVEEGFHDTENTGLTKAHLLMVELIETRGK
jgi:hypothetical protein